MLFDGPTAQDHAARVELIDQFSGRLRMLYSDTILAICLYGSTACNRDGPYSDIEMFCVISTAGVDKTYEWVYGSGKAEINVYGPDIARSRAGTITDDWALCRGQFLNARLIYGNDAILRELRASADRPAEKEVHSKIRGMIVEELYEWIGKLRNADILQRYGNVPSIACLFAKTVAFILGLFHRTCYTTGGSVLEESLRHHGLPAGYEALCGLVMKGQLSDRRNVIELTEEVWAGMGVWAIRNGFEFHPGPWPSE